MKNDTTLETIDYDLRLVHTQSATGYFACFPSADYNFNACLAFARSRPNDEFMRKHLLRIVGKWDSVRLAGQIKAVSSGDNFLAALFYEACLLNDAFENLTPLFGSQPIEPFAAQTPLIFIKSHRLEDHHLHLAWSRLFRNNIIDHHVLLPPSEVSLPLIFNQEQVAETLRVEATLDEVFSTMPMPPAADESLRTRPEQTYEIALKGLKKASVALGPEMRHHAALSHFSLLRPWEMALTVSSGRHHFRVNGDQTAYGRGLNIKMARAACAMEIVERRSAFASFGPHNTLGYLQNHDLIYATVSELKRQDVAFLDPNRLSIETPYEDVPLCWIEGESPTEKGKKPVWVPAQCVFLFCNLDETKLFSALGSTGLASGNTLQEAKVSALLEVIERDSESSVPYCASGCFDVETEDPGVAGLLHNIKEFGIQVQFQDLTLPMGVPCCKSFVISQDGSVAKGTGAHLDAKRALVSALTETPYPYPNGPPSGPKLDGVVRVPLESLPNYSSGRPDQDLAMLEKLLTSNGFQPIYVDLTREDIGLPVVRAIVPGMEILGDFDQFSRVSPKLFANYLALFPDNKQ